MVWKLQSRFIIGALALATACGYAIPARAQAPSDSALRVRAGSGIELLMEAKIEESIAVFREIRESDPQSPLGDLLEANALWWKIYYATGNLTDPEVFIAKNNP